jgi:hypothetical protein
VITLKVRNDCQTVPASQVPNAESYSSYKCGIIQVKSAESQATVRSHIVQVRRNRTPSIVATIQVKRVESYIKKSGVKQVKSAVSTGR